jgi:hypothetical protein
MDRKLLTGDPLPRFASSPTPPAEGGVFESEDAAISHHQKMTHKLDSPLLNIKTLVAFKLRL